MQTGTGMDAAICFVSPSVSPYHAAAEPTLFINTGKHDSQTVNIFPFLLEAFQITVWLFKLFTATLSYCSGLGFVAPSIKLPFNMQVEAFAQRVTAAAKGKRKCLSVWESCLHFSIIPTIHKNHAVFSFSIIKLPLIKLVKYIVSLFSPHRIPVRQPCKHNAWSDLRLIIS